MQSIHSRLSHLESENAALSQAAEEAATLAESLASENAELRGQLRSADALQSEKDGEIQRLSASCAGHIKEIHRLKTDLTETNDSLKEERNSLKELMDMQTTLRQTVTKLQQQQSKRKQTSSSLLRLINLHGSITKVLSLDSLHIVLFNTAFIDLIVQSISDNNNHNDNQHIPPVIAKPLIDALINARDIARRAFSWTLSLHQQQSKSISTSKRYSATQFKISLHGRARIIVQPVQALFDRVTASISDLQHPAFPVTNAAPVDVQAGLLQISIEAVDSIIADKESLDTINNNNNNNNNRTKRSSVSVPLVSIDDETMPNGMKNVLSPFYNHQDEKEEQKNFFRSSMPIEDQKEKENWKKQKK